MSTRHRTRRRSHYVCGDCGAAAVIGRRGGPPYTSTKHDDDCITGEALRLVIEADVRWLHEHPWAPWRRRAAQVCELVELTGAGIDPVAPWRVAASRSHDALIRGVYAAGHPTFYVITGIELGK